MIVGLYYDLQVDYAIQLWQEFGNSIANTDVVNGVSYARYWSLILKSVYEKEDIMVPEDEPKVDLFLYQHPKVVQDDSEVFPNVARIHDAMLHKIDLADLVLVAYLQRINPSIKTGVLLPKVIVGTSK